MADSNTIIAMGRTAGPRLFDCTLRDGSYPIQFQFSADDTFRIVRGLDRAGVPLIEVGHGLGLHAQHSGFGEAAATDREYIEAAASAAEEGDVGVFYIPSIGREKDIEMAADAGADFIRIGQNVTEWEEMATAIETAAECGLTVCGNLMKSYAVPPETVARRCADMEEWGADVTYIVDSAGGMLTDEVDTYVGQTVDALKDASVGFHCHDNLDLAVANSLRAIEAGASWIDATLQGIGRSAGNTRLETLATVMEKQGYGPGVDQKQLMDLGAEEITPLLGDAGVDPVDITSGYALFHTKFLDQVLEIAGEYDLDVRDLIVAVSEEELVDVSRTAIESVATALTENDDGTALERQTAYLKHSRRFENTGETADARSPTAVARKVNSAARKYGKAGVISITPAFEPIQKPRPSVLHRSNQAVLGNVQVGDVNQAAAVLEAVDGVVETIAIDISFIEAIGRQERESSVVRFDDRLAIARAIAYFLDNQVETLAPSLTVLGSHPVVEPLLNVLANRDWPLRLWTEETKLDRPSEVELTTRIEAAVQGSDVVVAFGDGNAIPVSEDVVGAMSDDSTLLDAGIRSISRGAIERAADRGIDLFRSETRAGYISEVECALITRELFDSVLGSRTVDEVRIVAGGVIGDRGDIVVDSIQDPEHIFGVADGTGGLIESPTAAELKRMEAIARHFSANCGYY